jgi:hypothetical protein
MQWSHIQHGSLFATVADAHAEEVASLMPLGRPFDGFVEHTKRVSPTCLVTFERRRCCALSILRQAQEALEGNVPSKTHVLNFLPPLTDGKAPPVAPIDAPQALRLTQEPRADVGRYDNLRELRA